MTQNSAKLILVGRVGGAFGVRGELRIGTYTESPLALLDYRLLRREDDTPVLTLESARAVKGGIVCRAREIDNKEAADALRGVRLFVRREALPPPDDEDEFYLADLIGLAAHEPHGALLGVVKAVHDFGAGDILEIDPGGGRASFFLPFTREIIPEVRLSEGRLTAIRPAETSAEDEGHGSDGQ